MKKILFVVLLLPAILSAQSFNAVFEREDDGAEKIISLCISDTLFEACLVGGGEDECVEFPRAARKHWGNVEYYGINLYNRAVVSRLKGEVVLVTFYVNGRAYNWVTCESEYERLRNKGF